MAAQHHMQQESAEELLLSKGEDKSVADVAMSQAGSGGQVGRPYQVELVEHALRENTIVNLGTGAGKTFVAVLTMKELAHQTEGEFTELKGQRTVFLAPTGEQ